MNRQSIRALVLAVSTVLASSFAEAEVKLHALFADHMVLQRDRPLPIWGTAAAGESVTVLFNGSTQTITADANGKWQVILPPQAVSNDPKVLSVKGSNELVVHDVLVGDVWLGTGQSNMDWSLSGTDRADEIKKLPQEHWNGIRLFKVDQVEADEPQTDLHGSWQEPTAQNILGFSATLFYFAEEVHKQQPDVPLGLVRSSVGATNLYCWLPNEVRDHAPAIEYLRTWWANANKTWTPEKQAQREREVQEYNATVEDSKRRHVELPKDLKKPGELVGPKWSRRPSALYNGMIAPLQPMALRGMIWYQGEWDSKRDWVKIYHDEFVAFATRLRELWAEKSGQPALGEFPVYLVQLPAREPNDGAYWPYMRETQERIAHTLPNSGFVVTYDTNDPNDLHPRTKTPVGQRLAWLALAKSYGRDVPYHGPQLTSVKEDAGALVLSFDSGGGTLTSRDGEPLRGFQVAGADGVYVDASAEVRDGNVIVRSDKIAAPKTVRCAFQPAPEKPNFFNSAGLPATPFRTDTQPVPDKIN